MPRLSMHERKKDVKNRWIQMQAKQIQIRLWTLHSQHTRKAPWERHETNIQIFLSHLKLIKAKPYKALCKPSARRLNNIQNKRKHLFSWAALSDQNIISFRPFSISYFNHTIARVTTWSCAFMAAWRDWCLLYSSAANHAPKTALWLGVREWGGKTANISTF